MEKDVEMVGVVRVLTLRNQRHWVTLNRLCHRLYYLVELHFWVLVVRRLLLVGVVLVC